MPQDFVKYDLDHAKMLSELFKRDSSCVTCDSTPSCPVCASDEQCTMTTQTCDECPKTSCVKNSVMNGDSSSSSVGGLSHAEIGGIAGSISAVFIILLIVGIYLLIRKYRPKYDPEHFDEEMKVLDIYDTDVFDPNLGKMVKRSSKMRRSYNPCSDADSKNKRMSQASLSTMPNSVFTKASNVLNIAYIPGVTSARPSKPPSIHQSVPKRNTRRPLTSVYSKAMSVYSKETYFSDLENASFHGGNVATKGGLPALVQIRQDDYDFDYNNVPGDDENTETDHDGIVSSFNESIEEGDIPIKVNFQQSINRKHNLNNEIFAEEDEFDEESMIEPNYTSVKDDTGTNYSEELDNEDAIQLDIGFSNLITGNNNSGMVTSTKPVVPTRYAALLAKNEVTNQKAAPSMISDPFQTYVQPKQNQYELSSNTSFNSHGKSTMAPKESTLDESSTRSSTSSSIKNAPTSEPGIKILDVPSNIGDFSSDNESFSDSDEENIEFLLQNNIYTNDRSHSNLNVHSSSSFGHQDPFKSPLD